MQIIRVPVGAFITNCYIAEGQEPGRGFLVDPADNPKKLISILEEKQICPEAILLTHGHYDHILAVPKLQERWKEIPVYCNAKDIPESLTEYDMGQQFPTVRAFKNVKTIEDGQELVIAGTEITVMETPSAKSWSIFSSLYPSPARISLLSSPRSGAPLQIGHNSSLNRIGLL